jgi:hypothetical protein
MGNFVQAGLQEREGKSAQEQAEAKASIDRANAAVLHQETQARTLDIFQKGRSVQKSIKAQAAGRGFASDVGTPLILQAEAIKESELASLEEQRIGLTEEGRLLQSAALNVRRGKIARRTSRIREFGSVIKGTQRAFSSGGGE